MPCHIEYRKTAIFDITWHVRYVESILHDTHAMSYRIWKILQIARFDITWYPCHVISNLAILLSFRVCSFNSTWRAKSCEIETTHVKSKLHRFDFSCYRSARKNETDFSYTKEPPEWSIDYFCCRWQASQDLSGSRGISDLFASKTPRAIKQATDGCICQSPRQYKPKCSNPLLRAAIPT